MAARGVVWSAITMTHYLRVMCHHIAYTTEVVDVMRTRLENVKQLVRNMTLVWTTSSHDIENLSGSVPNIRPRPLAALKASRDPQMTSRM